jgi:hypothetical protein
VGVGSATDMKYNVWQNRLDGLKLARAGRYHGDCCGCVEISSKPLSRHGALVA